MHHRGDEIARSTGCAHQPLRLLADALPASLAAGEIIHFALQWAGGSRHLHAIPLLPWISFANLVSAPLEPRPSTAGDAANASCGSETIGLLAHNLCSPAIPLPLSRVERGFGVELEFLSEAGPGRPDAIVSPNPGISAVLAALIAQLNACDTTSARSRAALESVERWFIGEDGAIGGTSERVARATNAACAPADEALAMHLLSATPRTTHRTEVRTPMPPHELSFAHRGADEVRAYCKLLKRAGAATPSISQTHALAEPFGSACYACTTIHVHVNVRNPRARGVPLSAREILHVVLAWIRFDLVTTPFARPWMWRQLGSAPLFATGPESAKQQTDAPPKRLADVPRWFAAVHAVLSTDGFDELDDEAQVAALFGEEGPSRYLGRYCSLNVLAVAKYGTLEARRYHGTLDGECIVHWAHLLVSFVEAFGKGRSKKGAVKELMGAEARLLGLPVEEGLRALQAAQQAATVAELMAALKGRVAGATAAMLMADAAGRAWAVEEEEESSEDDSEDDST